MSAQLKLTSEAEYLLLERNSPTKHEFYQGRIYAMTGASRNHNLIRANTLASLHTQLCRKSCRTYSSDMRVSIPATQLYTYSDVVIVCGQPRFLDDSQDTLLNPIVVIEVLSPSTERYDRGMKFQHYAKLPGLQDYILISQDQRRIEHFRRQDSGDWLLRILSSPELSLHIESIECSLHLDDVYEKVEFDSSQDQD